MIVIIGCGVECYRDRGAGLSIGYRLSHRYRETEGVTVRSANVYDGALGDAVDGAHRLIMIDTAIEGSGDPGWITHFPDIHGAEIDRHDGQVWHQIVDKIDASSNIALPAATSLFTIQGEKFDFGVALSQSVVAGIEHLISYIDQVIAFRPASFMPVMRSRPSLRLVGKDG